jgi:hypothetical protein
MTPAILSPHTTGNVSMILTSSEKPGGSLMEILRKGRVLDPPLQ